ncbi:hypothetical protein [Glycomyces rhizosphaerae]|uniref:Tetracyclin repressor-like C-terminal domain-containing protein n=1 Tax=Glycomyces rhizosphaerae TaxID=2054422 RepID=A0ABV7Q4C8_9ACTN
MNLATSLLTRHFLMKGRQATEAVIHEILGQIVMPLITPDRTAT